MHRILTNVTGMRTRPIPLKNPGEGRVSVCGHGSPHHSTQKRSGLSKITVHVDTGEGVPSFAEWNKSKKATHTFKE